MHSHLVEHPAACESTPALIVHILERYHETHRRELPALVGLAQKVETVHGTDPNAPHVWPMRSARWLASSKGT